METDFMVQTQPFEEYNYNIGHLLPLQQAFQYSMFWAVISRQKIHKYMCLYQIHVIKAL